MSIAHITLKGSGGASGLEQEQEAALRDLARLGHFQPLGDDNGPYDLVLSIEENRLVMRITNAGGQELNTLVLSLKPYRRLIQDYFLMLESYERARHEAICSRLEAIDMGRRGIHNEGAELLISRLRDKIDMDFETARRFFTLICVLHKTNVSLLR